MTVRRFTTLCVVAIASLCGSTFPCLAQERTAREVRQACDEEIQKIKAKADLRLARQNDLGPQRSAKLARIDHQQQLVEILPQAANAERALEATKRELRRKDTAYVLDSSRGGVAWHLVFNDDRFAADRAEIDAVFAGVSRYGVQLWPEEAARTVAAAKRMEATLKGTIDDLPMQDYADAKRFLVDLGTHCRLSVPSPADMIETAKSPVPGANQLTLAAPVGGGNNR
jgi:hypothetical protein